MCFFMRMNKWWQEVSCLAEIFPEHLNSSSASLAWGYCDYSPFIERNQWIEVEVSTNNAIYTLPLWQEMRVRSEKGKKRERKGFGACTNTVARAVNSPESCISEGGMGGWSQANTNIGLAQEDLHRMARFPPFQIQSPMPSSAALLHIPLQLSTAGSVIHWNLF